MSITIATYNVNSVRSRMHILVPWLEKVGPDIVCLQETKVQDHEFPVSPFQNAGYNVTFKGQKSYNGVAILSRSEASSIFHGFDDGGPADESRLLVASIGDITVVNTYVPQGRDVDHEMYQYKLQWFDRLRSLFERLFSPDQPIIWVGDINVAPTDIDIHDPKRLLGHVCFNPRVTEAPCFGSMCQRAGITPTTTTVPRTPSKMAKAGVSTISKRQSRWLIDPSAPGSTSNRGWPRSPPITRRC